MIRIDMPRESSDADDDADQADNLNIQRNKRSIAINLKENDGVQILKRLVRTSDILIESFRPDVKHRLGIDYDTLREINPRLIYASISGFGQTGPYQNRPGYDQVIQGSCLDDWHETHTLHSTRYGWSDVGDRSAWPRACACRYSRR